MLNKKWVFERKRIFCERDIGHHNHIYFIYIYISTKKGGDTSHFQWHKVTINKDSAPGRHHRRQNLRTPPAPP